LPAFLVLVIVAFAAFIIGLAGVSIWSNRP